VTTSTRKKTATIMPRPFQNRVVEAVMVSVKNHGRTMVIAPTGAGKTIMIGLVAGRYGGRWLVVQHREELVDQNRSKFRLVNPDWPSSVFSAHQKRFATIKPDIAPGAVTFAMVQTLHGWRSRMPFFDGIIFDECHHGVSPTWGAILEAAVEKNPEIKVIGFTATPNRSDKKGLGPMFRSVADIVTFSELIDGGYLVPPTAFIADVGIADGIANAKRTKSGEYDMFSVADVVDNDAVTSRIIELWAEAAGERQTIVFCATVAHAEHVTAAFNAAGHAAGCIIGESDSFERRQTIKRLERGELRVIVNVATLTEGFDCQPISCVIMLRPESFASVATQMIGRGLRSVDEALFPGLGKKDCIVMDFGQTLIRLGGLEQMIDLDGSTREKTDSIPAMKICWNLKCARPIPVQARQCPLCGTMKPEPKKEENFEIPSFSLRPFSMVLKQSAFRWVDLPDRDGVVRGRSRIASAGELWAVAFADMSAVWHGFVCHSKESPPRRIAKGTIDEAMSACDAWLSEYGDAKKYSRSGYYLRIDATEPQKKMARQLGIPGGARGVTVTLYDLGCKITAALSRERIRIAFEMAGRDDVRAVA